MNNHNKARKELKNLLRQAYLAGFNATGNGYNAEYPFKQKDQNPEDDAAWCEARNEVIKSIMGDQMKPADLNFKVLTPTPERVHNLIEALTKAGIKYANYTTEPAAIAIEKGLFSFWRSPNMGHFDIYPLPEVTFDHALELLAQVEASDPTFDIKLRDEVLCRHAPVYEWNFKIFTRVTEDYFSTTGHVYEQLIPFKGNEHLHGTTATPDGWWEVENGKPVWKRMREDTRESEKKGKADE